MKYDITGRTGIAWLVGGALALTMATGAPPAAAADDGAVTFAVQAWPGVTVKTKVASLILEAMGYDADTTQLSSSFVYQGIRSGDVDVSFGAWMPAHKSMLQPLLDEGSAIKLSKNMVGAVQGLAVPTYVWKAGIHTIEDLAAHGERFERRIYAIEPGAGMTRAFRQAVDEDYKGLGDWEVLPSSVAGMLSQVDRATRDGEAVVFHGWKPHWMDVKYDIRFLKDDADSKIADLETVVWTVVPSGWPEKHPEVAQFLRQFQVSTDTQSQWIYEFGYKEQPLDQVARSWITQHMDTVTGWLEGVQSAEGKPGAEAVRAVLGSGS